MEMEISVLTPSQRYAAAALFTLAIHQSQLHQTEPLNSLVTLDEEPIEEGVTVSGGKNALVSEDPHLWVHEKSGLLWPVFRFLEVDDQAWQGLKETAGTSSQVRHHVGAFLTLLSEASDGPSSEKSDKELALTKAVDAMVLSMESLPPSYEENNGSREYEIKCRKKYSNSETESISDVAGDPYENTQKTRSQTSSGEKASNESIGEACEKPVEEGTLISYQRKVTVLYMLLSACVAKNTEDEKRCSQLGKGYDARHRVALRLLATWLGVKWIKMEAMEIIATSSLMASEKDEGAEEKKSDTPESSWDTWKRGSIIGAAALTGGTLMAITGGLAAPAVAQGLGALAPTLGSVVPAIGASGFAAAASATGSVAGSTAVAASFGGVALQLMKQGAMMTVLSTLVAALALPATLITASDLIDSKWAIAVDRSDKAGKLLAEVLLKGLQGNRPVTLIGFSLGARVIFKCLHCLADAEGDNAGLVERVVLLGAPVSIKDENWEEARKMVAGRFVNAYSTTDWTLGIIFRASLLSQGLAGIQPVDVPGIENVDVTEIIEGHYSYLWAAKHILEQLELDYYYPYFRSTFSKPQEEKAL
ncbi:uncharacterized protein LOC112035795 isoform X2 [Quercus suber]|uniref:uncharacterized protein LOC112035795 isoform X2 n=1 Tax=Quercus suber TaxID=58331 RepID=UPI0032DFA312